MTYGKPNQGLHTPGPCARICCETLTTWLTNLVDGQRLTAPQRTCFDALTMESERRVMVSTANKKNALDLQDDLLQVAEFYNDPREAIEKAIGGS